MFTFFLERERYLRSLKKFLAKGKINKWVVIKRLRVVGFYDSYREAKKAVIFKKISSPVYIRQVLPKKDEKETFFGTSIYANFSS